MDLQKNNFLNRCPECGGEMKESSNDPLMLECEKCGYKISIDEAKDLDGEE